MFMQAYEGYTSIHMNDPIETVLPFLVATDSSSGQTTNRVESLNDESTTFLTAFLSDIDAFRYLDDAFVMTHDRLNEYLILYKETKSRCKMFTNAQWKAFEDAKNLEETIDNHEYEHSIVGVLRSLLELPSDYENCPLTIAMDLCREAAALDALAERA